MACDWGVGGRGAHREHAGSQAVRRLKVQAEEARPYLSLALEILDLKKKKDLYSISSTLIKTSLKKYSKTVVGSSSGAWFLDFIL